MEETPEFKRFVKLTSSFYGEEPTGAARQVLWMAFTSGYCAGIKSADEERRAEIRSVQADWAEFERQLIAHRN